MTSAEQVENRLTELERDVAKLTFKLDTDIDKTEEIAHKLDTIHSDILELIELWNSAKGFVKIVRVTGTVAKWVAGLGTAVTIAWYTIAKGIKF